MLSGWPSIFKPFSENSSMQNRATMFPDICAGAAIFWGLYILWQLQNFLFLVHQYFYGKFLSLTIMYVIKIFFLFCLLFSYPTLFLVSLFHLLSLIILITPSLFLIILALASCAVGGKLRISPALGLPGKPPSDFSVLSDSSKSMIPREVCHYFLYFLEEIVWIMKKNIMKKGFSKYICD